MTRVLSPAETECARVLIGLALAEDLAQGGDRTSETLIAADLEGAAAIIARQPGVVAGLPIAESVFHTLDAGIRWQADVADAAAVQPGQTLARVRGPVRSLLAAERTALNFLTHLSGVATLTRKYVDAVAGTACLVLDTRKTLPGWRLLEKYAVRCGGGTNHRLSLGDAALVKDNHLAALAVASHRGASDTGPLLAAATAQLREKLPAGLPIVVEVQDVAQLAALLPAKPDVILLDNLSVPELRQAVEWRTRLTPEVLLEASGGITLANVRAAAETGVDRASIGALTHSAPAFDMAMDWQW